MKNKYIIIGILILIMSLIITIRVISIDNKNLKQSLDIAELNIKAFDNENSLLKENNREFKLTIEQLNYFNDSIITEMNKIRKEIKIKDRDLKRLQYLLSIAQKKDTIVFRDTIFKDKDIQIDTLLGDKWYQLKLGLHFPNTITTDLAFTSEKFIIVNYKEETVNPPKKCFILRLFQRKHKVVEVNIVEKNPYILNEQQKFVEIIE